jgi:hypothetical protein
MIESLLLAAVGCAVVGGVYGAVLSTRTPSNDTSWRKQPPQLGKITSVDNTVDHLGRKEPTL